MTHPAPRHTGHGHPAGPAAPATHGHPAHAHTHPGRSHRDDLPDGLAEMLDLDAGLFAPHIAGLTGRIARLARGPVTRVVDLGAGTGAGTFALLERFPDARVTAVDTDQDMLARITATARARGLGERVRTLEADAGAGLPGVEGADLVWASASLHHVEDPVAALAGVRAALRPGGLLAVAELDGLPRFLPDDAVPARPGVEERCRALLDAVHAERVPHLGADWSALLAAAGLTVEEERTDRLALRAPLPESAGRYAHLVLARIRTAVEERADPADRTALDTLLDGGPQDVRRRGDLVVRSTRGTWIARRPAA
ncbi:class I SAM-dependent methyltransferase [Streptomyces tremellae]|uniref:Class I SAM-dependent methyltransferase n=1 Tax=Streptomyces tremellae TaxID=1124239 RepID=A0ABP7G6M1_9ACTN